MRSKSSNIPLKSFAKIFTSGKGKSFLELSALISTGNLKLPRSTAIFNMGPAKFCPSLALGLCKAFAPDGRHVCYAMKAERGYTPDVLPYRIKQSKFWKSCTAEEFASQFLMINALKERPYTALRLNESGDFHKQECVQKADKIASILGRYGIKVYCYTHRSDLDFTKVRHLVVTGSNFQKEGVPNTFLMVENVKDKLKGYSVCPQDCRICNKCMIRGNKIVIKRH